MRNNLISLFLISILFFLSGCVTRTQNIETNSNKNMKNDVELKTVKIKKYSLIVNAPKGSTIKIMNIKPKYYYGIKLKGGNYLIRVINSKYKTYNKWISLKKDRVLNPKLSKIENNKKEKLERVRNDYEEERPEMDTSIEESDYEEKRPIQ